MRIQEGERKLRVNPIKGRKSPGVEDEKSSRVSQNLKCFKEAAEKKGARGKRGAEDQQAKT